MRSCLQCRDAKRKCVPTKDQSCTRCLRLHLGCSHSQSKRAAEPRKLIPNLPAESQDGPSRLEDLLSDDSSVALPVEDYLSKIHGRPHSIFHAGSLWRDIRYRRISKALLLAICAMGSTQRVQVAILPLIRSL